MKKDIAFGGVTRIPGGALSSDGDLCAAVDVCNDGAGLEMLEKPDVLFALKNETSSGLAYTEELLCVHEPEGEEKHYITQLVVVNANVQAAPAVEDSDNPSAGTGGNEQVEEVEPVESEPITPDDPYIEPTHDDPPDIDDNEVFDDVVPYIPPESAETYPPVPTSDYESAEGNENQNHNDNGGTSVTPPSGGSITLPTTPGVYLIWSKDNGDATRTVMQYIDITAYGKVTAIQPMGNTLICNHEGTSEVSPEIRYYLFKVEDGEYVPLGSNPPFVDITFGLESTFEYWPKTESTFKDSNTKYKNYGGISITSYPYTDTVSVYWGDYANSSYVPPYEEYPDGALDHWSGTYSIENVTSPDGKTDIAGMKVNWTTMALGCYNKFIAEQHKNNKFVFPFYVRYAVELYDGSLIMHSYPVLLIPNSRGPIFALDGKYGLKADRDDVEETYEKVRLEFLGRTYGFSSELRHQIKALSANEHARLENWKDLIRGINIYVTPPIYNYKQGGQVLGWHSMSSLDPANNGKDPWAGHYTQGKVKYGAGYLSVKIGDTTLEEAFRIMLNDNKIFWRYNSTYKTPNYCLTIPQKDEKEILELHENAGQFYKLASIDFEDLLTYTTSGMSDAAVLRDNKNKNLVNTISNQDIMQDDNGSHDTMSADVLYGYNRRLNMANVSKILHSPLPLHTQFPTDYTTSHNYHEILYVKNKGVTAELRTTSTSANVTWPKFLFYPGKDAQEAIIIHNSARYKVKLKEHKALNGMFWLSDFLNDKADLSSHILSTSAAAAITITTEESNKIVDERNKIYTSETDNPFYVPFGNINIAGGGEVRALCSATQAMSQGQFGQHPMYCFTSEGVWAMTVGDTGGWATIQPVTRDVISEQTKPLSLDSTVVFLTERGLLQLAGSDIKVLSDVLQGADPLLLDTPNFGLHRLDDLCGENATGTGALLEVATALAEGKFPEKAWLAYDYDNARIYVTPWDDSLDYGTHGSWVYNLKSGLWTQASATIDRQVPTYPELETQSGGNVVKISVDRAIQGNLCAKGLVISRPIKLADMGLLKRWREIAVRGRFKPYSTAVQVALWGTRDWIDHALVASSTRNRLTRWSGSPYFGHSVALFLTKPNYAMQVAGMDVEVDAEHDNKLR